jgi:hypothetical protein
LAINHFTKALEVFHSAVGSKYDRIFWSNILFARAEAYLVYQQYQLMEMDIKQALIDCPQQLDDLVSFITYIYFPTRQKTPSPLLILNNIVDPESGVTILFNIVDNYGQCGQQSIVQIQSCFHQYCNNLNVFTRVVILQGKYINEFRLNERAMKRGQVYTEETHILNSQCRNSKDSH